MVFRFATSIVTGCLLSFVELIGIASKAMAEDALFGRPLITRSLSRATGLDETIELPFLRFIEESAKRHTICWSMKYRKLPRIQCDRYSEMRENGVGMAKSLTQKAVALALVA